jgi:WD40 repeat protein
MPEKKNTKRDMEDDLMDLKCGGTPSKAGKLLFTVKDLTSPEVAITDVLINLDYRYFHTGTSVGHILVWKFDDSKKRIHSFRGHFKEVSCLMPARREPDLLISAALDSTVRIWSLDKF